MTGQINTRRALSTMTDAEILDLVEALRSAAVHLQRRGRIKSATLLTSLREQAWSSRTRMAPDQRDQ